MGAIRCGKGPSLIIDIEFVEVASIWRPSREILVMYNEMVSENSRTGSRKRSSCTSTMDNAVAVRLLRLPIP